MEYEKSTPPVARCRQMPHRLAQRVDNLNELPARAAVLIVADGSATMMSDAT
jgi:hypothetical protein